MKAKPITPEIREAVLARDGYRCVGPDLARHAGVVHPGCRTRFGDTMDLWGDYNVAELQIDHVSNGGTRITSPRWLQALCPRCHLDGFATRKDIRAAARLRLELLYGEEPNADTDY